MRIAIVYRLTSLGGLQSCVFSLIKGLNQIDIIPEVLWDQEPRWSLLAQNGLKANYRRLRFVIPSKINDRLPGSLRYLAGIVNVVDGGKIINDYDFFYIFNNGFLLPKDVPHIRYIPGPPLLPQLEKKPSGVRGIPLSLFKRIYRSTLKKKKPVYEFHQHGNYVTISQFTRKMFSEAYGLNLPLIYPPVDLENAYFSDDDWRSRDSLTFFSRFIPYKRPEMVLELANEYPNLRCVMMGGVPKHRVNYFEELSNRAMRMKNSQVEFIANPSGKRVKQELGRSRYYVCPTVNEHFGMTTVEAIASGALPFVHDSGGQQEIVCDKRLRFVDIEINNKFNLLTQLDEDEIHRIRNGLFEHIQQYSEARFISKMLSYL